MADELDYEEKYVIDKIPTVPESAGMKRKLNDSCKSDNFGKRKRHFKAENSYNRYQEQEEYNKQSQKEDTDSLIKSSIAYYENVLKDLKKGIDPELKNELICNTLEESEGSEIELACHGLVSHCLELLLTDCKEASVILRFMTAFAQDKITVCTSANASHLTELLIYHAVKALPNWSSIMDSEDNKEKTFVTYCVNWLVEFGNFVVENLDNCLYSQYSCHVVCTLIGALAGDLAGNKALMSKNLKNHKKEFQSQFTELRFSTNNEHSNPVVLEQIPKVFSDLLRALYKTLVQSEYLIDFINNSSSATVIEALILALKKRCPKACKKMIKKLANRMFLKRDKQEAPLCLLNKNTSFVFDEMFKAADEDLQLKLWNEYVANHMEKLVTDPIGNYVVQRLYDAISNRTLLETICLHTWSLFHKIAESQNFGIFVSISTACNRLGAQQSFFVENIMQCLQCYDFVERQDFLIPLLLGFKKYDDYISERSLDVCLQGSLIAQAILKFHKPMKAVKSILSMSPEEIEFLAGHIQGCHVLNAFFGSATVGEKNKEKLLLHLQPVLVSVACDRNKSLTLSRIWTSLSLKLKEIVARQLVQHQQALKSTKSGYAVFQKFGIPRFRKLDEWKRMQSNISNKKYQKH